MKQLRLIASITLGHALAANKEASPPIIESQLRVDAGPRFGTLTALQAGK
jgi:hypothetical protein